MDRPWAGIDVREVGRTSLGLAQGGPHRRGSGCDSRIRQHLHVSKGPCTGGRDRTRSGFGTSALKPPRNEGMSPIEPTWSESGGFSVLQPNWRIRCHARHLNSSRPSLRRRWETASGLNGCRSLQRATNGTETQPGSATSPCHAAEHVPAKLKKCMRHVDEYPVFDKQVVLATPPVADPHEDAPARSGLIEKGPCVHTGQ